MAGGIGHKRRSLREKVSSDWMEQRIRELRKEFNYVLQLSGADTAVLADFHTPLAQGAASFAQAYYDFLFDNPATADVLYSFEREGGNVGDLVRSHLQQLVSLLDPRFEPLSSASDFGLAEIKPIWMMGAHRLYLDHLTKLIRDIPDITQENAIALEEAVIKRVFINMGMLLQCYWDSVEQDYSQANESIADERGRVEQLLSNIPQMLWSVDVKTNEILYASPATEALCTDGICSPIPCMDKVHADDQEKLASVWQSAVSGEQASVAVRAECKGQERWFMLHLYPTRVRRRVARIDGMMEDITAQREALSVLETKATKDVLTDLANRTLFYDRVSQAISQGQRSGGRKSVLMLLDLNHFKMVNDTLGHTAGDGLLRQVAVRLQAALRESDTLARMGSDEFAILMPEVDNPQRAGTKVARKIMDCFKEPFLYQQEELFFSTAIGIAIYPDHGSDTDTLLNRADVAMYRAKRSDQGYEFYDHGDKDDSARQLQVSGQLRHALERNEFELYYQPRLDMRTMQVCGAEALLRWHHPHDGVVGPAKFLHVAEQLGLMSPITNWVLVTALRQCKEWRAVGINLPVSVNVSAHSFRTPRFLDRIQWALSEAGVGGECLEIEITEDILIEDLEHANMMLGRFSEMGVKVSVDDFGTGYSSLSSLKRLPIQSIKIDRSFLKQNTGSDSDGVIVRSIIELGHNLGFRVVAEGVETDDSWRMLDSLGCDEVQGYRVGTPMERADFSEWMTRQPVQGPAH